MGSDQSKPSLDNTFKEGDIVYANECPTLPLIIRRYVHRVYYCRKLDDPEGDEMVYYERELVQALRKS